MSLDSGNYPTVIDSYQRSPLAARHGDNDNTIFLLNLYPLYLAFSQMSTFFRNLIFNHLKVFCRVHKITPFLQKCLYTKFATSFLAYAITFSSTLLD